MKVILPGFSCVVHHPVDGDTSGLQAAISDGYQIVYVTSLTGIMCYRVLAKGKAGAFRYVSYPVKEIPKVKFANVAASHATFLPEGPIPYVLFETIKGFFRDVIAAKKSNVEAMIWVMWNEAQGYFLHVPDQVVGPASAKYDWSSLPENSQIIVDIHSHGSMGAFFSGTDDNDDKQTIRFSGVIGHNDKPNVMTKWRFNCLDQKYDVNIEDIFLTPQVEPGQRPGEWLDKVKTYQELPKPTRINPTYSDAFLTGRGAMTGQRQKPVFGGAANSEFPSRHPFHPETEKGKGGKNSKKGLNGASRAGLGAPAKHSGFGGYGGFDEDDENYAYWYGHNPNSEEGLMSRIHEQAQQAALPYEDPEEVELEIQRRIRKASSSKVDAFAEGITVTKEGLTVFVPACDISPEFHSEVINRGMDVAAAVEIISKASESLVNEGEPLRRTVEELFMIVKQDEQLALFRTLNGLLPPAARDSLAQNGL